MEDVTCLDREGKDLGEGVMMTTTTGSERLGTFLLCDCWVYLRGALGYGWVSVFRFLAGLLLTDDLSSSEGVDCLWVLRVDLFALPNTNTASRG
jgi:hypothetical protein